MLSPCTAYDHQSCMQFLRLMSAEKKTCVDKKRSWPDVPEMTFLNQTTAWADDENDRKDAGQFRVRYNEHQQGDCTRCCRGPEG